MKSQLIFFITISVFAMIFCSSATAENVTYNYTNDIDFDNGTMTGLEHNTTQNQLQISNPPTTIPFIWVPNSNNGTVSKVDTRTGKELARYRVSPYSYSSPSRTTVDLQGNCWVANRQTGTAVKIGLYENGGYIDRNMNGIIETSRDLNDDGIINGDELLAWGADECVLYDVILIPGKEGTYVPGQYIGGYANDGYNPGPRGIAVDAQNNIWVGTYATMKFYYINGFNGQIIRTVDVSLVGHTSYGAIIDENGILWSSGHNGTNVLRLNPKTDSFTKINIGHFVYGLGIDRNNHLFVSGWTDSKLTKIDTLNGTVEWTKSCPTQSRGITVTDDGDVWVANSLAGTVTRYSNDGVLKATINVGNTPTGLSMDANGKVWVVNYGDEYIKRINPATNTIELSKIIPGGLHYGYSDMTGAISRTITTKLGTWTLTHDSGVNNVPWSVVSWNSFVSTGTSLKVQVRISNDKINWSNWEEVQNGVKVISTPSGRYLQILTTFQILSGQTSPILYDLSVKANVTDLSVTGSDSPDPVIAGEKLTYNVTINNNGPSDDLNVTLTGNRALENIEYSLDNGNTWSNSLNIGIIVAGGSKTFLIRGKVPSSALGSFKSTWIVNSNTTDLNLANNAFTESTAVITRADISVTIGDNRDPVSAGEELTYRINVRNVGPSDARNVIIHDTFPSQLQNIQYSLDNGSTWGNWTGSLNLGTLIFNNSKTVLIKGKIHSSALIGSIINTATVSSDTTDLNSSNNAFSESTTINIRTDLAITITASNTSLYVGENVKFIIKVKNNGPSDAKGVKATYYLPSGIKHISISSNLYNLFNGLWSIGNLTSGLTVSLEITAKTGNVGLINNTATVSGNQSDPNTANNRVNVLLNVYLSHGITPGNYGNGNSNSGPNGNQYGNSGQTNPGSGHGNGKLHLNPNNFSIYGPLAPYLTGNGTPLSDLFKYSDQAWKINNKGSVYGPFAGILNSPFNPFGFQFYTWDKLIQASQKAWQTGNVWDFFNYNFYHIYGYNNLDKMWGGQNIKQVIKFLTGIDENGNVSVGNFILLLASIVPIARVGTWVGKILAKSPTLMRIWRVIGDPLAKYLGKLGIFTNNPIETLLGITSKIGSFLESGLGLIPAVFEIVAGASGKQVLTRIIESPIYQQLMRYDTLRSITTVLNPNNWNWNNFINTWNNTMKSGINIVKWTGSTLMNGVNQIVNKAVSTGKKVVTTALAIGKKVINKVVTKVKSVVSKTVNIAKKTVKEVVKKVAKTVKKVVRTVKKVVKKVVKTVKKVVRSIKAVNNVIKAGKQVVNAVTNIGKSIGRVFRLW